MRIRYVVGSPRIGGGELHCLRLAQETRKWGHDVELLFLRCEGPLWDEARKSSLSVKSVVESRGGGTLADRSVLQRRLDLLRGLKSFASHDSFEPEVVHAHLPGSVVALPFLTRARGRPLAQVATVHGSVRRAGSPLDLAYGHRLRSVDAVIAVSKHTAYDAVRHHRVHEGRLVVIHNGTDRYEWEADPMRQPPVAVVVGRLDPIKAHDQLLRALALIDDRPVVRICGDGSNRRLLERTVEQLGLGDTVQFVPVPADVESELAQAQFAIHPSWQEALSKAVLEQTAAGLPVIASRVGGTPEVVVDGVNGLLVPPGDLGALARAIETLAQDPVLRGRLGQASRVISERFSWEECVERHLTLYGDLL